MKSFCSIFSLLIFLIACTPTEEPPENPSESPTLPNIVLLVGDDQGYPYFGFMGADYVHTPHMDSLAASGTLFTQGYVPANHCRPSLQSLMTGTLPIDYDREVNALLDQEKEAHAELTPEEWQAFATELRFHAMQHFKTLPKLLAESGYVSFQGGKWWEYSYENGGFSEGMTTGWTAKDRENGSKWFKQFMGGSGLELARATMEPVYDFIDKNSEAPFFIWYAPELPHYPFDAPDVYYNRYRDQDMTESAKRYYANCTWFDEGVGELTRYLKEKEEFDNTLFIYVNDNGWEQNPDQEFRHDSLRWHNGGDKGKLSMYDQSFRTPIIFSWKGHIEAGVVKQDLIHSADIPATILDYLGLPVPGTYFGQSYRPVIEGKASHLRGEIIGNIDQMRWEGDMMGKTVEGYWLRNEQWFFKWNLTLGTKALFDMEKDPRNEENVAEQNAELVEELTSQIEDWKRSKGR